MEAQSTQRLERQIAQVSSTLTEIVQTIQTTQLNIPKYLGYPGEAHITSTSSHGCLEDVLGRRTISPADLCRTFHTFHDILKIMFSEHPGLETVVQRVFEIMDGTTSRTIFGEPADTSTRRRDSLTQAWVHQDLGPQ